MVLSYIVAIMCFLLLHGFFAGSEAALTAINKIRLRHLVESKNIEAIMVDEFLKKEGLFLGTTLVGTNLCTITGSALATGLLSHFLGANAAALFSTAIMTTLTVILGEIVPKTIYRQTADAISLKIIKPLTFSFRLFYPLIFLVTRIAKFLLKPFSKIHVRDSSLPFVTKSDFKLILRISKERGGVEPDEEKLIYRIFDFGVTTVNKVMIPLYQIASININDNIDNIMKLANEKKFSRIPVYENEKNNIVGIVNIYDILFAEENKEAGKPLRDCMQSPYFINDDERIDRVLSNLKKKKRPMAIVINKEGKSTGLVTIEDILEEIVGEIGG